MKTEDPRSSYLQLGTLELEAWSFPLPPRPLTFDRSRYASTRTVSRALFFETISAFERTEALRTAIELDLFTRIAAGHHTAAELAAACAAAPRGVRILADYLTILGFLRKHDDRYELTPDANTFLNRTSPAYLGGA